ncbi:hypothetical protein [Amycolatopsis sp. NPDC051102]|uniref:hypothetical protein n=1 Tax=Amycolatopsis sp. NPDC051102 TaxID=3155163 RepID=UPI0034462A17
MFDRHDQIIRRLAEACRRTDVTALAAVLHADAVATCDGGGFGPVHGAEDVIRLVMTSLGGPPGGELTVESVNGRAGLALRRASRAVAVVAARTAGSRVAELWIVLDPAKLTGWHRG